MRNYKDLLQNVDVRSEEFLEALFNKLENTGLYEQNMYGVVADSFVVDLDKKICAEQFKRLKFILDFIVNNFDLVQDTIKDFKINLLEINQENNKYTIEINTGNYYMDFVYETDKEIYSISTAGFKFICFSGKPSVTYRYNTVFRINELISSLMLIQYYLMEEGVIPKVCNKGCYTKCKNCN